MPETPVPVVNGASAPVKTPAERLFDRKAKLMENLNCRELFDQLDVADDTYKALLDSRLSAEEAVNQAKANVIEAETMVAVSGGIDGKNETERKASKQKALLDDVQYQSACRQLSEAETAIASVENEIEAAKRICRRMERQIDYRTAILRFFGGD